jgi:hypothetical protein
MPWCCASRSVNPTCASGGSGNIQYDTSRTTRTAIPISQIVPDDPKVVDGDVRPNHLVPQRFAGVPIGTDRDPATNELRQQHQGIRMLLSASCRGRFTAAAFAACSGPTIDRLAEGNRPHGPQEALRSGRDPNPWFFQWGLERTRN